MPTFHMRAALIAWSSHYLDADGYLVSLSPDVIQSPCHQMLSSLPVTRCYSVSLSPDVIQSPYHQIYAELYEIYIKRLFTDEDWLHNLFQIYTHLSAWWKAKMCMTETK